MVVLIVGNGSIGKQHADALLKLGEYPVVYTQYPDNKSDIRYVKSLDEIQFIDTAIICTPTNKHLSDFKRIANKFSIKKVLIEKPIAINTTEALEIKRISIKYKIIVYVAFDMRFISKLQYIKANIHNIFSEIRIVNIYCGQYLPDWRPNTDYRDSYSSHRERGGGVDLDLTHEIDYMLWLFGIPEKIDYIKAYKISKLEIDSPDYFKGIYKYTNFIIDVELDYIRKLDRKLVILGENKVLVNLDFIKDNLLWCDQDINISANNITNTLNDELQEFLSEDQPGNLCTLNESIEVLKMIRQ